MSKRENLNRNFEAFFRYYFPVRNIRHDFNTFDKIAKVFAILYNFRNKRLYINIFQAKTCSSTFSSLFLALGYWLGSVNAKLKIDVPEIGEARVKCLRDDKGVYKGLLLDFLNFSYGNYSSDIIIYDPRFKKKLDSLINREFYVKEWATFFSLEQLAKFQYYVFKIKDLILNKFSAEKIFLTIEATPSVDDKRFSFMMVICYDDILQELRNANEVINTNPSDYLNTEVFVNSSFFLANLLKEIKRDFKMKAIFISQVDYLEIDNEFLEVKRLSYPYNVSVICLNIFLDTNSPINLELKMLKESFI